MINPKLLPTIYTHKRTLMDEMRELVYAYSAIMFRVFRALENNKKIRL